MTTGEQSPAAGITHPVTAVVWPTVISPQPGNTASTTAAPGSSGMKPGASLNQELRTGDAQTAGTELIGIHVSMAGQKSSGIPRAGSGVTLTDRSVNGPAGASSSGQGWNLRDSPCRELNPADRHSSGRRWKPKGGPGSGRNPIGRCSSGRGLRLKGSPGGKSNPTGRCSSS